MNGGDTLYGMQQDDVLYGGEGDDNLTGNEGSDKMFGGIGNDHYVVVDALDVISENASEGIDSVYTFISYALPANVENLTLAVIHAPLAINGTGNAADNVINGNSLNNSLDGGAGNDTLYGEAGDDVLNGRSGADKMYGGLNNDRYLVDNAADLVVENAAEGTDTVVSTINYTLNANVENLTLDGTAINGTGNDLSNSIAGNASDNVISGKGGADTINGRSGNDVLIGGAGNDSLFGDAGADKFSYELPSDGIDTIRDFDRSQGDKIQIIRSSFGATSLNQFSYNSGTGALTFDASPSDGIGPVQLATIANKPAGFSVQSDVVLV